VRADHGSYFVTMYMQTELTRRKKERKKTDKRIKKRTEKIEKRENSKKCSAKHNTNN